MSLAGRIVREVRAKTGLTQEQVAERSDVSRNSIANYERGKCEPTCHIFFKLLQGMGYQRVIRPQDKPVDEKRGEERYI